MKVGQRRVGPVHQVLDLGQVVRGLGLAAAVSEPGADVKRLLQVIHALRQSPSPEGLTKVVPHPRLA